VPWFVSGSRLGTCSLCVLGWAAVVLFAMRAHQHEGLLQHPPQALKAAANTVKQPAVQEVHSPLRLYIFSYLTLVLIYVVASGEQVPSYVGRHC
jgi:hypothetical protein